MEDLFFEEGLSTEESPVRLGLTDADSPGHKLGAIAVYVKEMKQLEEKRAEIEANLKAIDERYSEISAIRIPEIFAELQLSKISLADGRSVAVEKGYSASISKDRKQEAFSWLRGNGHEGIIKSEVTVAVPKGSGDASAEALYALKRIGVVQQDVSAVSCAEAVKLFSRSTGLSAKEEESVHASTLKAWVREQINNGEDIPRALFGVFDIAKTVVK